jgi:aryl-alcohol dehydrogenase-like predicted oxidoreductase
MRYRPLGRTGLEVSEIGFGAWGIGGALWADSQDAASNAALDKAVDCGVNFIDTALAYGDGHSEKLIAGLMKRHPKLVIATKVPPKNYQWPAKAGVPIKDVFPLAWIIQCTENSLRNLELETLHLQQLHVWSPEWVGTDEWKEGVYRLKKEGKIRFFGISINDHDPNSGMEAIATGLIDTVQVIYNIFDQSPEDKLFPLCQKEKIGVLARVPFDEGSLAGAITLDSSFPAGDFRNQYFKGDRKREVVERTDKIRALIKDKADSLPEAALRYCLSAPALTTVIPGMRNARHVESNAAASDAGPLPAEVLAKLKEHRWVRNFYA